jgi:threonine dehydrogenase-like Zn-dependent dehydrogenase
VAGTTRAVVQTGPRALELRELPIPDIDDDSALLRVEACGICGSDAEQYVGTIPVRYPLVPGHEPLGVIERIGDRAAKRWRVDVGDRVAVEAPIPCGHCRSCITGHYNVCRGRGTGLFGHGYVPLSHPPGIWGAYADVMYLDPHSLVHKIRKDVPASIAVMFNALGAGFRWGVELPDTGPGDVVLILGPGQRGLTSVVAARAAGADTIIVTGLTRDAQKLAVAKALGADHTIDVEREDARSRVRELTNGHGADVIVEVSANSPVPIAGVALLRGVRRAHRVGRREGVQAGAGLRERPDRRERAAPRRCVRRDVAVVHGGDPADRVGPRPARAHAHARLRARRRRARDRAPRGRGPRRAEHPLVPRPRPRLTCAS